jgi:hypothetical protein
MSLRPLVNSLPPGKAQPLTFHEVLDRIDDLVNDNDRVRLCWFPYTDMSMIGGLIE